jgi:arylsulfatase A-like enzyme/tetratricopeptide (TPR) repeat protein
MVLRLLFVTTLAAALAGCGGKAAPKPAPPGAKHLVLVTIDTLRADRLGIYGNAQVATPNLDRIGREGAFAEQASAHVPLTRPSHVSLMSGRLPFATGIRDNISPAVLPGTPLLAEALKRQGFRTGAFVSSVVLEPASGLNRGFDTYSGTFEGDGGGGAQFLNTLQRRGDLTTADATAWLEEQRKAAPDARLFLWLHLYDPHDPYEPPEPYATRYAGRLYDGEVAFADDLVGRLDAALERLRMRDDALVVVTSDHGEGLGEHGETLHGFFAYQATLHVPLLVRGPGIAKGTRLKNAVPLVDVFPTALALLGVPLPPDAMPAGRSLAAELRGGAALPEPLVYAETLVPLLHFGWSDLRVVREGRWKYVQAPRPELYDLANDPGEKTNLAASEPRRVEAMRTGLTGYLDLERAAGKNGSAAAASPELLEKLGALGYVGGGGPAETATPGADPKDRVEDFRFANDAIRNGLLALHAKRYAESVARFQGVLKRGISSFEIHLYLARALMGLGRAKEAVPHFEEALRRQPQQAAAWENLAAAKARSGDLPGAVASLRKGREAMPDEARLFHAEARLLWDLKRLPEARKAFEAALPLAPQDAKLRCQMGELLRETGDVEGAIARQKEAVALDAKDAGCWNSLGMTLGGNGKPAEAEDAFRRAIALDATSARFAYNLGLILQREGRGVESRPFFEKALALDPGFAPARQRLSELSRP